MEEEIQDIYPEVKKEKKDTIWHEGVLHPLSKETFFWNFSLIYKAEAFDIIKWKNSKAWKIHSSGELLLDKALFIGVDAGVFFISVDEKIDESFTALADMMDVFLEKTKREAPFIVYAVIESKQKIAELKNNKEMLKNVADIKKWAAQHGGEFRLENLKEIEMNLTHLITEYCHYILSNLESKTNYKGLRPGEVHFLDYEDLSALKEIEEALEEQAAAGQTVDNLLSNLFFEVLKNIKRRPEYNSLI